MGKLINRRNGSLLLTEYLHLHLLPNLANNNPQPTNRYNTILRSPPLPLISVKQRSSFRRNVKQKARCLYTKVSRNTSFWTRWESTLHIVIDLVQSDNDFSSGAFSNVYKALDLSTGQKVAGLFLR
jgi:hypothetical protein